MPFVDIPANTWTTVVTTSGDTVVQNRGGRPLFMTTESTGSLDRDEALEVPVGAGFVFSEGKTVSARSVGVDGVAFYMGV